MARKRQLILALAVIFALNIFIIALVQSSPGADAASYKKGSSGSVVTQIQKKLSAWGYYSGKAD
ncbi:MAG: spore cortex-lytic enzyme, partial [Oscillospiraceae bacterium]|nr:spore cortex-lytic enzyme [Oscillospiraceae bacterium]